MADRELKEEGMSNAKAVTDGEFRTEVLESKVPVVVDFWATWCGPCVAMGPVIDALAAEYEGRVKVLKLNVDENPRTPSEYGVRGIPTLIIFKNGAESERIVGAQPKGNVDNALKKVL
ncbi:MAG: Thioredoxin-1 [Syntrophorhabdus sp. PtaB.Bin184]|nr:MAG: Thioredoxin-1 [Syntrophorhabdus sp. PtaB.Bin184]